MMRTRKGQCVFDFGLSGVASRSPLVALGRVQKVIYSTGYAECDQQLSALNGPKRFLMTTEQNSKKNMKINDGWVVTVLPTQVAFLQKSLKAGMHMSIAGTCQISQESDFVSYRCYHFRYLGLIQSAKEASKPARKKSWFWSD